MQLLRYILLALCILFILPLSIYAEEEIESIIIEVEGDPEEHKSYIETYYPQVEVVATYHQLLNGLALQGPPEKLARMDSLDFIKAVHQNQTYEIQQPVRQPLNKDELEEQQFVFPSQLNTTEYTGKGVKVGVIDTGIDYNHPDLKENYKAGYDLVDLDDDPMETLPEEGIPTQHGTHVAGIIAANGEIQGVAPEAEIYAYRALGPGGTGTSIQVIAAMEQAIEDGVDVMNLSLGNSVNGPDYPTSKAVNRAVELGVPVVIANGNNGPEDWTVGAPATATKALSVGASTNVMKIPYLYVPKKDKKISIQQMMGSIPWNIDFAYPMETNRNAENLTGKIALIERTNIPFYDLAKQAENKGAEAVVIYNNEEERIQGSVEHPEDPVTIPVVIISKQDGEWLLRYLEENKEAVETVYEEQDVSIASFSSRGPVTINWRIKPDVLAPGTNVLSTVPGGYRPLQGTSMAAPHVAGVIALIKEAHPNWSTEQIYGAIQTTALQLQTENEKVVDPIIQGTGVIQPAEILRTDTIIHNGKAAFGKIENYNETKKVTIQVENMSDEDQQYSFDIPTKERGLTWKLPHTFTVNKGETKEIPLELTITSPQLEKGLHQGWLTLKKEDQHYLIPYLFMNETADYPKAMGFEFTLQPFSRDTFIYRIYLSEPAEKVEVDLYKPKSLLYDRTLLSIESLQTGMNEGKMDIRDVGEPGEYTAIITVTLENGEKESYESMLYIPDSN